MISNYIASHMRSHRKMLGLTQTELGKLVNISCTTISRCERNDMPLSYENALKIKNVLQIEIPENIASTIDLQKNNV